MNFSFLHNLIISKFSNFNYLFINFYQGYDTIFFIIDILKNYINSINSGNLFLLGFNDNYCEILNRFGLNIIIKPNIQNKNLCKQIISISPSILLSDLISSKISYENISYIILSENFEIKRIDSKIIFILEYLKIKNKKDFKLIQISNIFSIYIKNIKNFINLKRPKKEEIEFFFIPRNNKICEEIITYNLKLNNIEINEYNLKYDLNNPIFLLEKNFEKLMTMSIKECLNTIKDKEKIKKLENYLNLTIFNNYNERIDINFLFKILDCYNPLKLRNLFLDIILIKKVLKKIENYDLASLFYIYRRIQREKFENKESIFNYEDRETENVLNEILHIFKDNLYSIKKTEFPKNIENINKEEIQFFEEFKEILNFNQESSANEIFLNFEFNLNKNKNLEILYPKYKKLINIIDNLEKNKSENVLIITDSEFLTHNLKQILISYFILKDDFESFYNFKFLDFLENKYEFEKRHLNLFKFNNKKNFSNLFVENFLLHYFTFKLLKKVGEERENIFYKILIKFENIKNTKEKLMPNDIIDILTDSELKNIQNTLVFNEDTLIENKHIEFIELEDKNIINNIVKLQKKLLNRKFNHIIFYNTLPIYLRNIECFIANYENNQINKITLINNVTSFKFKLECENLLLEFKLFQNNIKNYNNYKQKNIESINNDNNSNNNNMEIDIENNNSKNILIDFRENNALTPFYLFKNNFNITIGSLEIGDYIITNNICIERKSISSNDILNSLKNFHLNDQMIKMLNYYETIIILLEFNNFDDFIKIITMNKLFYNYNMMKKFLDLRNIKNENSDNKILFFWSLSAKMTSEIIMEIKNKYLNDYLDIELCLNKGKKQKNKTKKIKENKNIECFLDITNNENKEEKNIPIKEETLNNKENDIKNKRLKINVEKFLRKIDGVTMENYSIIINNFKNLKDFINCDNNKLYSLLKRINGNKIKLYLNLNYNDEKK